MKELDDLESGSVRKCGRKTLCCLNLNAKHVICAVSARYVEFHSRSSDFRTALRYSAVLTGQDVELYSGKVLLWIRSKLSRVSLFVKPLAKISPLNAMTTMYR